MLIGLQPSEEALSAGTVDSNSKTKPTPREVEGTTALLKKMAQSNANNVRGEDRFDVCRASAKLNFLRDAMSLRSVHVIVLFTLCIAIRAKHDAAWRKMKGRYGRPRCPSRWYHVVRVLGTAGLECDVIVCFRRGREGV